LKTGVPILDASALSSLHTKTLLARVRRLQQCEGSADGSDMTSDELAKLVGILFKDTPEWEAAYTEVKRVLASREHVPHGPERLTVRMDRVQANQTAEHRRRRRPMQ